MMNDLSAKTKNILTWIFIVLMILFTTMAAVLLIQLMTPPTECAKPSCYIGVIHAQ